MFCLAGLIRRSSCASHSKKLYCLTMSLDRPALHPALDKVSWLLGKWKGEGCGVYPTISPFSYGEEIIFDHVGQPMLSYNSRTWNLKKGNPMHHELGWLKIKPGTSSLAFIITQNTGLAEIEEGEVEGHKIHLVSHTVGRTSFNKDPKVIKIERLYLLKDPDTLEMECFMETSNTGHQKHLHITYKKTKEQRICQGCGFGEQREDLKFFH